VNRNYSRIMRKLFFKNGKLLLRLRMASALMVAVFVVVVLMVSPAFAGQASGIPTAQRINPVDLVGILQSSHGEKPLMIQVGSHVLFAQAHIPGSEYIGPASSEDGLRQLRKRGATLPRSRFIVSKLCSR
jgi:hypothetical protein